MVRVLAGSIGLIEGASDCGRCRQRMRTLQLLRACHLRALACVRIGGSLTLQGHGRLPRSLHGCGCCDVRAAIAARVTLLQRGVSHCCAREGAKDDCSGEGQNGFVHVDYFVWLKAVSRRHCSLWLCYACVLLHTGHRLSH